jgi:hypothetical protein
MKGKGEEESSQDNDRDRKDDAISHGDAFRACGLTGTSFRLVQHS